jgi:hypothetical protein
MNVFESLIEFCARMEDVIVESALPDGLSAFATLADPLVGSVAAEGKRDLAANRIECLA